MPGRASHQTVGNDSANIDMSATMALAPGDALLLSSDTNDPKNRDTETTPEVPSSSAYESNAN